MPPGRPWIADVLGERREFCCGGCQAAAEAICSAGLDEYYRLRTENAPTVEPDGRAVADLVFFDRSAVQASFVRIRGALREVSLLLEGIRCPACLWLNERRLRSLPGVAEAIVDYASRSARVLWDPSQIALSAILSSVREIGYAADPVDPAYRLAAEFRSDRRDTARLAFAGLVGMMVMNLAFARYLLGRPDARGGLPLWETFARWCELFGAAVLLAYPGQDFFVGAWRDFRRRRAGMDTPIVLGLVAAFAGSAAATLRGAAPVYFDAIAMLVFFVLLARAFETRARLSAAAALDRFAVVAPISAMRVDSGGRETPVPPVDLSPGDLVRLRPGEVAPADGLLLEGESSFDEAVLTGEPWNRLRRAGDEIVAGSVNGDQPVLLRVTRAGEASTLGDIRRLLEKGLASRPAVAELADRLAPALVTAVLLLAGATALFWGFRDAARAFPATLAVLIVTCPCALALATPIALALSAGRLAKIGVLPARMAGLESLATADTAAFDKTGTLTLPVASLESVDTGGGLDRESALGVASALESASGHPAARALCEASPVPAEAAKEQRHHPGQGVSGVVGGVAWWIGSPEFAAGSEGVTDEAAAKIRRLRERGRLAVFLADRRGRHSVFGFAEQLRPGARGIVAGLRKTGIRRAVLLSGDRRERMESLCESLGFDETIAEARAEDKLAWIQTQKRSGRRVLFVGDGLNDAPTLAAASTSVSFARAPDLSRLASDFLLLGESLSALTAARRIARRSRRLLLQNVGWALAYNLLSVPLAASGRLPPWAAALGMSASSLLVVANAMRLTRPRPGECVSAESAVLA